MPGRGYHNASVDIGDAPIVLSEGGYISCLPTQPYVADPRWPARCSCGYEFTADDQWQVNQEEYYRADDGREWPHRSLPAGAMFDAWWMGGSRDEARKASPGGDGVWLAVVLPPGGSLNAWIVDGPARNNPNPVGWSRSGTVKGPNPTVTASPSILSHEYHGWLRSGVLVEC
jgi:hypothetical protein